MGWEQVTWWLQTRLPIRNDRAAALVEWGLLVVLVAVVTLIAVQFAGNRNSAMWSEVASSLDK